MQPAGLILAGGRGRRMGGVNKALLTLGGRTLLDRAIARLSPQVTRLSVSAGDQPSLDRDRGLTLLPDTLSGGLGPLAGVLAGMCWAADLGEEWLATVAVDTPFLPDDLVPRLARAAEEGAGVPAIAASRDPEGRLRPHGTCALWPVGLRGQLAADLEDGQRKVMAWAEAQGAVCVEFPAQAGIDPFFNINRPEDLIEAEAWLQRERGRA